MKQLCFFLGLLVLNIPLFSQSLFESSFTSGDSNKKKFQIYGYIRSNVFANETDYRSVFGETSIKLETKSFKFGNAFSEIRIKQNLLGNGLSSKVDFREGYVNLYLSDFDFRIGRQIIVWGRADGFNPTNNLTPQDFTAFSPDEDDKRLSNFVLSCTYNFHPYKLIANWVPVYKPGILPFKKTNLPEGIIWGANDFPPYKLSESNYAIKLSIEKASFDGSVSYFNGYHKLPGLCYESNDSLNQQVYLTAHHTQIIGFDFSTAISNYGLRGEFAFSNPSQKKAQFGSVPKSQLEYTIGLDREWGNFNLITQYIGKYVIDFHAYGMSANGVHNPFTNQLTIWNKMIYGQQNKLSHSISLRPSLSLVHQTLSCEILSLFNITTEEIYVKPKIAYKLSDNLTLSAGAQLYQGPENTLFDILSKGLNAGFFECKVFF
ncbi:MAG: hypothetical protein IMY71_00955 [Bacteroidetes bacterium]|nr:hypothetical protein [Bacteroidota bacterium]